MEKEVYKQLIDSAQTRFDYVSVFAMESTGKTLKISGKGIEAAANKMYCSCGCCIKAQKDGRFFELSVNDVTKDRIPKILDLLEMTAREAAEHENVSHYDIPRHETIIDNPNRAEDTAEYSDEDILKRLSAIREKALKTDERILDCVANCSYQIYEKMFMTKDSVRLQRVCWMSGALFMLAGKGESVRQYFKCYSNASGGDVFDEMQGDIEEVSQKATELLSAETIKPGTYECICTPEVTGMIAHEAFGHGVEMDMFVKDRALAKDYIGKVVASSLVTMHDGAAACREVASYIFDDEGNPARDTVIIENGILKSGICDMQTAMALNTPFTGNGRREDYERKAYTRMTNTFFEAGKDNLSDMISSIEYGFLLENATCGMEDPKNWGIQCMVNVAREIKNGNFTGKIFSPIVLSGYVPELLKSISMVSKETKLCGSGACGKGYKEFVKVSDGGAYIKARIKLG